MPKLPFRLIGRRIFTWLLVADLLRNTYEHWKNQLVEADRKRLLALLRQSKGKPGSNLSPLEQHELRELVKKLDLGALAKSLALTGVGAKTGIHPLTKNPVGKSPSDPNA